MRETPMLLRVALSFAEHPHPNTALQAPADTVDDLREALRVLAAAYRADSARLAALEEVVSLELKEANKIGRKLQANETRLTEVERDAARYQWLLARQQLHLVTNQADLVWTCSMTAEEVRHALDGAMQTTGNAPATEIPQLKF